MKIHEIKKSRLTLSEIVYDFIMSYDLGGCVFYPDILTNYMLSDFIDIGFFNHYKTVLISADLLPLSIQLYFDNSESLIMNDTIILLKRLNYTRHGNGITIPDNTMISDVYDKFYKYF